MLACSRRSVLLSTLVLGSSCTATPAPSTPFDSAVAAGYLSYVLPPLNSGCGRVQPGYDPGDPAAMPPVPATLDGAPYDVFADDFCTAAWTYRFNSDATGRYWDEWVYVVDMGEPDPAAVLPEHLAFASSAAAREASFYCHFRWRLDVEPYGEYPVESILRVTRTLEEVSHFCSTDYTPSGFPVGEIHVGFLVASSDPDTVLWVDEASLPDMDDSVLFQGFTGMPEIGGWTPPQPGGWTYHYRACTPRPTVDGTGPGPCLEPEACRYFSGSSSIERCSWDLVHALPSDAALVSPAWRADYPDEYADIYGAP